MRLRRASIILIMAAAPTFFVPRSILAQGHGNAHGQSNALRFEIESWARAGDKLAALLYNNLRLAKEIQLNMWSHFCVRAAVLAGGRPKGGVTIRTRWVDWPPEVLIHRLEVRALSPKRHHCPVRVLRFAYFQKQPLAPKHSHQHSHHSARKCFSFGHRVAHRVRQPARAFPYSQPARRWQIRRLKLKSCRLSLPLLPGQDFQCLPVEKLLALARKRVRSRDRL